MTEDFLPDLPDEEGFVDQEAMQQLIEKVVDVLRPLGLTVMLEGVAMQTAPEGDPMLLVPCIVRSSAKKRLDEDKASREALNKMLAEQHDLMIEEEAEKIRKIASDPTKLDDLLFGDGEAESECSHERKHPSGFCLDCGEGMDE